MQRNKVLIIILAIMIFIGFNFYYFGLIKKTCDSSECFLEYVKDCSPVKYGNLINNNKYKYEISRSFGSKCKLWVYLERASEGTDFETKEKLVGKSMRCLIPKDELAFVKVTEVNNLLQYCTGSLKEGIYEIIIKNMYNLILSNLGEVLSDVQTSLIKQL